jgi:predicted MFS family arabinose efflux permease
MLQASVRLYKKSFGGLPLSIWWLSLVMFVNRSGTMVIPFLTVYLVEKGFTLTQAGFVMASFGVGAILGGFIGGRLTDKYGSFFVQFASLFINGIMFYVLGQMQSFWSIAVCVFALSSLGEAFRPANAAAIAAYSDDANRTRCYSLNRLAVNLGWSIGPAVGGILASISYSWLFIADGTTCIIASILLYIVLSPKKIEHKISKPKEKINGGSPYRDKIFLTGMFYMFLVSVCFFQVFSILPVFYKQDMHFSKSTIGILLALNGLIIALFEMIIVYQLENKRSAIQYIVIGAFLLGLSFLLLIIPGFLLVALTSIIVITIGEMLLFPFMNSFWVSRSAHHNRGQYAAVYTMTFALAQVVAPTVASPAALHYGFNTLFICDFILCSFAALGFYFLWKKSMHYDTVQS